MLSFLLKSGASLICERNLSSNGGERFGVTEISPEVFTA
jgi:hypothetical protein